VSPPCHILPLIQITGGMGGNVRASTVGTAFPYNITPPTNNPTTSGST